MTFKVVPLKRSYSRVNPEEISTVTKDVPVPPRRAIRYPFGTMEVGDSFTCPYSKLASVKSNLTRYKRMFPKLKREFTHRPEGDDRLRVWRIK